MKPDSASIHGRGVEQFLAEHGADVTGVIRGFDRLRLRASRRWLDQPSFMQRYLCAARVLLNDFAAYATGVSHRIRAQRRLSGRRRCLLWLAESGDAIPRGWAGFSPPSALGNGGLKSALLLSRA